MARENHTAPLVKKLHDRLEKSANNSLRGQDLTTMQVSFLLELETAPEVQRSMKELERHFGIAQSTVAGIVSRLEQKGLVETHMDPADKRMKQVRMTPAGKNCCAEAAMHMEESEENLLKGFTPSEREQFNALLLRAFHNLD